VTLILWGVGIRAMLRRRGEKVPASVTLP
jgi:hypothetical protein